MKNWILNIILALMFIYPIVVMYDPLLVPWWMVGYDFEVAKYFIPVYSFLIFLHKKATVPAYFCKSLILCILLEVVYYFWVLYVIVLAIGIYGFPEM